MFRYPPTEISLSVTDINLARKRMAAQRRLEQEHERLQQRQIPVYRPKALQRSPDMYRATDREGDVCRILGHHSRALRHASLPAALPSLYVCRGDPQKASDQDRLQETRQQIEKDDRALHQAFKTRLPESSQENDEIADMAGLLVESRGTLDPVSLRYIGEPIMDHTPPQQRLLMRYLVNEAPDNQQVWSR